MSKQEKLSKADDDYDYQDFGDEDDASQYEDSLLDNKEQDEDNGDTSYEDDESDEPDYEAAADASDFEDEDDAAGEWLKDKEKSPTEDKKQEPVEEKEKKSASGYTDWKPRNNYSPEHSKKMKEHMDNGYSHREAERMAGAHEGPRDMQGALRHTVKPSLPSEKMLGDMKGLAAHWLDNANKVDLKRAELEKNPDKYAAGKLLEAHEAHTKDFKSDYENFLNSDEVKKLKGMDRHKAVQTWKKDWQEKNPDYKEGHKKVAEAQTAFQQAHDSKRSMQDKVSDFMNRVAGGGMFGETYSDNEAAQHVGADKDEGGAMTANIQKDPAASFAQNNPEWFKQRQAQMQPKQETAKPKEPAKTILRRNPGLAEHANRYQHIQSQRAAMGVKPSGDNDGTN